MGTPFEQYDLKKAKEIVALRRSEQASSYLAFYNGDHLQNMAGWSGPLPRQSENGAAEAISEIRRAFVCRNAIKEVTDRHTGGVAGRPIHWKLTPIELTQESKVSISSDETLREEQAGNDQLPTASATVTDADDIAQMPPDDSVDDVIPSAEQLLIDEGEAAVVEWWDNREVSEALQRSATLLLLCKQSVLRFCVPPGRVPQGFRGENGVVSKPGFQQALDALWLETLGFNEDLLTLEIPEAIVYTDKDTRQKIGIYVYKQKIDNTEEERAELTYLDADGNTVLRIVNASGDMSQIVMELGGRLTMYEMTRPALLGEPIVSLQKLLNLSLTMMQRNVVQGGFLERILLNAQLPGKFVDESGIRRFVPDPIYVGAGTTNAFTGLRYKDKDGNEQITNPSVSYRDPVPVVTFTDTGAAAYLGILQESQQLHYALAGDSVVSGESRKQARDAFEKDLMITAGKVEGATRWIVGTALAMADFFAGQPLRHDTLRVYAQARVDSGPISADEMRAEKELAGDVPLRSQETAMSNTGIEDVDAELQRIESEKTKRMESMTPLERLNLEQAKLGLDMQRQAVNGEGLTLVQQGEEDAPATASS